ncbi:MAG: hypothetical protein ABEL51_16565 [Salinibacter sp.]
MTGSLFCTFSLSTFARHYPSYPGYPADRARGRKARDPHILVSNRPAPNVSSRRSPTLTRMREWTERLRWLTGLPFRAALLDHLANTKVRQFASEADALEAGDMKVIRRPGKRHTLFLPDP